MDCIVPRPIDKKLKYINILIESGVLNQVDSEVAQRLLEAVMKTWLIDFIIFIDFINNIKPFLCT